MESSSPSTRTPKLPQASAHLHDIVTVAVDFGTSNIKAMVQRRYLQDSGKPGASDAMWTIQKKVAITAHHEGYVTPSFFMYHLDTFYIGQEALRTVRLSDYLGQVAILRNLKMSLGHQKRADLERRHFSLGPSNRTLQTVFTDLLARILERTKQQARDDGWFRTNLKFELYMALPLHWPEEAWTLYQQSARAAGYSNTFVLEEGVSAAYGYLANSMDSYKPPEARPDLPHPFAVSFWSPHALDHLAHELSRGRALE